MGEKAERLSMVIKEKIFENIKKNLVVVFVVVYLVILAIWNLISMYAVGDIGTRLFWLLLVDALSTPIIIVTSIVLTGKWKTLDHEKSINDKAHILEIQNLKDLHTLQIDIALKKQEIDNLKLVQQQCELIDKQQKEAIYIQTISEYKLQYLALKYSKDWEEANKLLEEIDKRVKEEVMERINALNIGESTGEPQ